METDYTNADAVAENLADLKEEKRKGKNRPSYHVKVLNKMAEEMPAKTDD